MSDELIQTNAKRRRWLVRIAFGLVVAMVAAELGWLALFSWAVSSGKISGWLNRRPDKVKVEFSSIASRWPGSLELTGLRVDGRTARHLEWHVAADHARVRLLIPPLLARTVSISSAVLDGVEVKSVRHAMDEGVASSPPVPTPAPDPGSSEPAGAVHSDRRQRPPARWSFHFDDLVVHDVRTLELDDNSIRGGVRGEVGFAIDTGSGKAEIYPSRLELDQVTVIHKGEVLARNLVGSVQLALSPYDYREDRGPALVPHASGRIELTGELDDRPIVDQLVEKIDWVEIEPGTAPVDADLRFRQGRLLSGSRLKAVRGASRARLLDFEIEGSNELSLGVDKQAHWEVRFTTFDLRRGQAETPLLTGKDLVLSGTADVADLSHLAEHTRVQLELGEALLPDLGFLREWLPPGAGIEKLAGSARVAGQLAANVSDLKPTGELSIDFDRLALQWRDRAFAGKVAIQVPISGGDVRARRLELDGSKVSLDDFSLPASAAEKGPGTTGWWMRLKMPRGSIRLGPPVSFDSELEIRMKDTQPLLALFETRKELPRWAEKLLTKEDVRATGRLSGRPGDLSVDRLVTELLGAKLDARLRFAGTERVGKMLLSWQRLSFGLGFQGAKRDLRFINPKDWYEAYDPAFQAAPPEPPAKAPPARETSQENGNG